jgi:hypothetical protein
VGMAGFFFLEDLAGNLALAFPFFEGGDSRSPLGPIPKLELELLEWPRGLRGVSKRLSDVFLPSFGRETSDFLDLDRTALSYVFSNPQPQRKCRYD